MQPNGSRGRSPYDRPASYRSTQQEPNGIGPHQDSPSRRRGQLGFQEKDTPRHPTTNSSPRPSGGLSSTEVYPKSKGAQWIEYFSAEDGCTMEYNPATGETRAKSSKINRVGTAPFFPEGGSSSGLEQTTQIGGQQTINVSRVVADERKAAVHRDPLDEIRPGLGRLQEPFDSAGAGPSSIPSSLQVPETSSRPAGRSRSSPSPVGDASDKDRPVTVRDMELFTKAIQTSIREMGAGFVKAVTELYQREGESDDDL